MKMNKRMIFRLLYILLYFHFLLKTSKAMGSDFTSSQVLVQFDLVQLKDWPSHVVKELQTAVANFSSGFCKSHMTECNLVNFSDFSPSDVIVASGYPKLQDVNSLMLFHVALPQSSSVIDRNDTTLKRSLLTEIVFANRVPIQQALIAAHQEDYEASYRVSYIENVLVLVMSDQTLNQIIIPITCVVVVVLSFVIIGFEIHKRRSRKAALNNLQKERNQTNKSDPVPTGNREVIQVDPTRV